MASDNDIIARLRVDGVDKFKTDMQSGGDAVGEMDKDIKALYGTLDQAKTKLSGLKEGTKEFNTLSKEIKATELAMNSLDGGMENAKVKLRQLQSGIVNMTFTLKEMEKAGLKGTTQFKLLENEIKSLTNKAGELKDTIGDVSETVRNAGSDTRGIDNALRAVTSLSAGFSVVQGASALFGKENENLQKTLIKLNAVMAITQGLQQIQAEALRNDSIFTLAATKAKQAFNFVVGQGTFAMKAFRLAMVSLGIGAFILAIQYLVENWDRLKVSIFGATQSLEEYTDAQQKANDKNKENLKALEEEIKYRVTIGRLTKEQGELEVLNEKTKILKEANSELGKQNDKLKDLQKNGLGKTAFGINVDPETLKIQIDKQTAIVKVAQKRVQDLTVDVIETQNEIFKKSQEKASKSTKETIAKQTKEVKQSISEIDMASSVFGINSERYIKNQIDLYTELKSTLDIGSEAYIALGEVIDALNKKLAGKQEVNIDTSGALAGLKPIKFEKKISLFEQIFGSKQDNEKKIDEVQRMANGALKIVDQLNQYGQQIANISSQAIGIKAENELRNLEEKKKRGVITEKEYEKQVAQVKNEAAQKQRTADILMATAQIPLAVLSAFTSTQGGIVVKGIAAGLAGAFALAQVALLSAAPLPKFKHGGSVGKRLGLIKGRSHEQGGVPIEVEGDEYVHQSKAVKYYGVKFMDQVNEMKFNPVIQSGDRVKNKAEKDYRMNENLATMTSYLKQVYKTDAQGNIILTQIRDNIAKNKGVYV